MTKQNQNLFGDVIPEKDIKVKASLEANQGWVSFFYKTCRIGDAKYAVLAGHIIQFLQGEYRTALILNQLVGEDLHPIYYEKMFPRIATYLDLVSKKVCKKHNLWQNCYLLAKSPKWYMDNALPLDDSQVWNGKELEDIRQLINVKLGLS